MKSDLIKLYPRCHALGICLLNVKNVGFVVPDSEMERVLEPKQRKIFDDYYGVQTRISEGMYAWDVEAVLERMTSKRLTGTQLLWD